MPPHRTELQALFLKAVCTVFLSLYGSVLYHTWGPTLTGRAGVINPLGDVVGGDFLLFYAAAALALAGKAAVAYDPASLHAGIAQLAGHPLPYLWTYPPSFFLFLLPFTVLPYLLSFLSLGWGLLALLYSGAATNRPGSPGALVHSRLSGCLFKSGQWPERFIDGGPSGRRLTTPGPGSALVRRLAPGSRLLQAPLGHLLHPVSGSREKLAGPGRGSDRGHLLSRIEPGGFRYSTVGGVSRQPRLSPQSL